MTGESFEGPGTSTGGAVAAPSEAHITGTGTITGPTSLAEQEPHIVTSEAPIGTVIWGHGDAVNVAEPETDLGGATITGGAVAAPSEAYESTPIENGC